MLRPVQLPSLLSHNGLAVPEFQVSVFNSTHTVEPLRSRLVVHGPMQYPSLTWGVIALADGLRPDVDVSRNALRKMPLRAYSTSLFALRSSLQAVGLLESSRGDLAGFTFLPRHQTPTFNDLVDQNILNQGDWDNFPCFPKKSLTIGSARRD